MPKTPNISLRLVKMIKRFPELYNSEHDLANDKTHSMVVWDTISYELDTPVSVLKKKWQKLRSSHRKKCRSLKSSKSSASLPRDDVFLLMNSMLDAPGGDSPGDGDDSSLCSVPTLSIISEEGRSTRSNSTSTTVPEVGMSSGRGDPSAGENPSDNVESLPASSRTSGRILRSQQPRATRSGPPEAAKAHRENIPCKDSTPENIPISSSAGSENRKKSFGRITKRQNEPVRAFFESMALTVAGFPQHIQAATKTKICNIVVEAELQLSSPASR